MHRQLITLIALLLAVSAGAQEITSSPYSFFGIGVQQFKGTAENKSMGGLSIVSDSIHANLSNPAGLGALKLTAYTIGVTRSETTVKSGSATDDVEDTSIDYLALAFPAGNFGFSFGLIPETSVGYSLREENETSYSEYKGNGGLTRLFLSTGYRIDDNWRVGIEGSYNFGNIYNESIFFQDNVQYGTKEVNESDLSGFKVKVGAQYQQMINKKLQATGSFFFAPSTNLSSENRRVFSQQPLVLTLNNPPEEIVVDVPHTEMELPSEISVGAGIGAPRNWFAGLEYVNKGKSGFNNRSFNLPDVEFKNSSTIKLGGYYIPDYNDITSYFKRVVFRAGAHYGSTGLNINGEDINEFGISFGLGLPAGNLFSNVNLGVEYGQHGTTAAGLVEEEFLNIFIGLSFNDKWFQKRKFN